MEHKEYKSVNKSVRKKDSMQLLLGKPVYTDDVNSDGADAAAFPRVVTHAITVELYEDRPDDAAEAALERAITSAGLPWEKQDRYWLQSEQQYQVIYEFDYTEKVRA